MQPYIYNPTIGMTIEKIAVAVDVIIKNKNIDVKVLFCDSEILIPKNTNSFLKIYRSLDEKTN